MLDIRKVCDLYNQHSLKTYFVSMTTQFKDICF